VSVLVSLSCMYTQSA